MLKEGQFIKKSNGQLCILPIEEFLEREDWGKEPIVCNIITQEKYGWWVYEKTNLGGSMYDGGLSDEIIIRDITEDDVENILKNNGKCFIQVDSRNILSTPSNVHNKKIVIHLGRSV